MDDMSADKLREVVETNLPIGIGKDQVVEFLTTRDLKYSEANDYPTTPYGETNLEWISLLFRRTSWLSGEYKIAIEFYFDKESKKLVRYRIYESYPSL